MSSIPSINNTPTPEREPEPELSKAPAQKPITAFQEQVVLNKEAEARAREALAALESPMGARGATGKKSATSTPEGPGADSVEDAIKDEEEAKKLEALAKATTSDPTEDKQLLAQAQKLMSEAKSMITQVGQETGQAVGKLLAELGNYQGSLTGEESALQQDKAFAKDFPGFGYSAAVKRDEATIAKLKQAIAQTNNAIAQVKQGGQADINQINDAVNGIATAIKGLQGAVSTAEADQTNAQGWLSQIESNPEIVMFLAMIDMSTTTGKSISAYYAGVKLQNAKIAKLNSVLTELDNLEEKASAQVNGKGGGPNGTVSTSSIQATMTSLGISLGNPANSTQIGDAAQSVNNQISSLSTQSSTAMDELQMLSNDYNTDSQQLSSFLQSISQTQQGTAHNM